MSTPQTNIRDPYENLLDSYVKSAKPAKQPNRYGAYDAKTEGAWSIADAPKVKDWYRQTYKRDLPVSAFGQSGKHNSMGLDHADSVDVGLNPTMPDGAALVSYLKQNNIPYLAYDRPVKNAATNAHIHIGYPSHKGMAGANPHRQESDPYTSMLVGLEQEGTSSEPNPYDSILDELEKGATPATTASQNPAIPQPVNAGVATRQSSTAPQPPPPTFEPQMRPPTGLEAQAQLRESATTAPRGMIEPGTVETMKRPVVKNRNGSISTVRSMSTNIDGREVLLPTISDDGRILTDQQAVEEYKRTGKHLGIFETPEAATEYAKSLHEQQAQTYVPTQTEGRRVVKLVPRTQPVGRESVTFTADAGVRPEPMRPVAASTDAPEIGEDSAVRVKVGPDDTPERVIQNALYPVAKSKGLPDDLARAYAEQVASEGFNDSGEFMRAAKARGEGAIRIRPEHLQLLNAYLEEHGRKVGAESQMSLETGVEQPAAKETTDAAEGAFWRERGFATPPKTEREIAENPNLSESARMFLLDSVKTDGAGGVALDRQSPAFRSYVNRQLEGERRRVDQEEVARSLTPEDKAEVAQKVRELKETNPYVRSTLSKFLYSTGTGGEDVVGGIYRVAEDIVNSTGLMGQDYTISDYFKKRAHMMRSVVEEADRESPLSPGQKALAFGSDLLGNVAVMAAMSELGGSKFAFGGGGFLGAKGRGEGYDRATLEGVKGLALEKVFKTTETLPLAQRAPTIAAATYGIEKATGATDEDALKAALTNAGFVAAHPALEGVGRAAKFLSNPREAIQGRIESQLRANSQTVPAELRAQSPPVETDAPTPAPPPKVVTEAQGAQSGSIPTPAPDTVRRIHGTSADNVQGIFAKGLNYKSTLHDTTLSAEGLTDADIQSYTKDVGRQAGKGDATVIVDLPQAEARAADEKVGRGEYERGAISPEHIVGAVQDGQFIPNPNYKEATPVETPHHSEIQPRDDSGQFRKVTTKDLREARERTVEVSREAVGLSPAEQRHFDDLEARAEDLSLNESHEYQALSAKKYGTKETLYTGGGAWTEADARRMSDLETQFESEITPESQREYETLSAKYRASQAESGPPASSDAEAAAHFKRRGVSAPKVVDAEIVRQPARPQTPEEPSDALTPDGLLDISSVKTPEHFTSDDAKADYLAQEHMRRLGSKASVREFYDLMNRYYDKLVAERGAPKRAVRPQIPEGVDAPQDNVGSALGSREGVEAHRGAPQGLADNNLAGTPAVASRVADKATTSGTVGVDGGKKVVAAPDHLNAPVPESTAKAGVRRPVYESPSGYRIMPWQDHDGAVRSLMVLRPDGKSFTEGVEIGGEFPTYETALAEARDGVDRYERGIKYKVESLGESPPERAGIAVPVVEPPSADPFEERKVDNVNTVPSGLRDDAPPAAVGNAEAASKLNAPVPGPRAFREQMKSKFRLSDEQADAVTEIADARANAWAKENGKDPSDYYAARFGGIVRGGEAGPGALNQSDKLAERAPHEMTLEEFAGIERGLNLPAHPTLESQRAAERSQGLDETESRILSSIGAHGTGGVNVMRADIVKTGDDASALADLKRRGFIEYVYPDKSPLELLPGQDIQAVRLSEAGREAHGGAVARVPDLNKVAAVHRGIVEQAIAEGKNIPAKVLENYPDLKRKALGTTDPNLLRQEHKAAVEFMQDGRAIIRAFKEADVSSAWHEMAHVFRRDLSPELLKDAESAIGVKDGKWAKEHDEKFARGFERYLKDGYSPSEKLKRVFEAAKQWLTEIYGAVRGKTHPLRFKPNPELVSVFDRMLDAAPKGEHGGLINALHKSPQEGVSSFLESPQVKRILKLKPEASTEDVRWALAGDIGKPRSSHLSPDDVIRWADSKGLRGDARKALDFAVGKYRETIKEPTDYQKTGIRKSRYDSSTASMSEAVRAMGGLRITQDNRGEMRRLHETTTGLTRRDGGLGADEMIARLKEDGYFGKDEDVSVADFLSMLEEDAAGSQKRYSSEHEYDFEEMYRKSHPEDNTDALDSLLATERGGTLYGKVSDGTATGREVEEFKRVASEHGVFPEHVATLIRQGKGAKAEGVQGSAGSEGRANQRARRSGDVEFNPAEYESESDILFQSSSPQIHTPEFRKWFGKSKVVDESGEPLRVYHGTGTKTDFTEFKTPAFFASAQEAGNYTHFNMKSGEYGTNKRLIPVYLSLRKPYVTDSFSDFALLRGETAERVKALKRQGYDGIIYRPKRGEGVGGEQYVAFEPTQIKSATGNRGTFDRSDPNILYQSDHTQTSRRQRAYKALLRERQPDLFDEMGRPKEQKPEKPSIILKARRAVILSGIPTLAKLTAAAGWRIVGTPVEEVAGGGLSKIAPNLAGKAPREGRASIRAEMTALKAAFSTDTLKEAWGKLKTGESDRDRLYGKRDEATDETVGGAWLDFFGRMHGALKVPAQRAEFYRSLEKRGAHAARNGVDLNDPAAQLSIGTQAYADSKRAILMQDNLATDVYKEGLRFLRKNGGDTGKAAASIGQLVFPIVKVPTNYVREAAQYIPGVGAAEGFGKIILRGGIKNLKPEEADAVMRAFKKQGVGFGLVAIGFLNPQAFGGYYTKGERDEKDLHPGEMKLFGVKVPHLLSHSPALEAIQFGATVRRVLDTQKSAGKDSDAVEATYQAGKGLAEEAPFIDSYLNAGRAFENTKSAARAAGEFAKGLVIPPDVQRAAKYFDADAEGKPVKRYPQGGRLQRFAQSIETGIPGLRQNVPDTKEGEGGGRSATGRSAGSRKSAGRTARARPTPTPNSR